MSDLQNLTPANTYKALLQLDAGYTNGISGSTGANALQVSDGAGNNTSLALSTNRVGIGNTSPSAELDVSGDVVADEYALDQTGSSSSAVAIHAPAANELAIRTNSAERVRIDSSGNVAIGTTSSSSKLTARISDNTAYANETPDAVDSVVAVVNNPTAEAVNNHSTLHFNLNAVDHNHVASISLVSESDSVRKGALTFCTDNGATRPEAMRIDSAGNIGIGTTSPSAPLEVTSTTGGVIMPRMNTSQRTAISASDGEMVYDTDLNKFYGYANGAWVALH